MRKKTHFTLFIFVILVGTAHVDLTASEEQKSSDKIPTIIFSPDGTKAITLYENEKRKINSVKILNNKIEITYKSKKSITEKVGLSPRQIIQILETIDPSLPTNKRSEAKLEEFLKNYFSSHEVVSFDPHESIVKFSEINGHQTKVGFSEDETNFWIDPEATENVIKELAEEACSDKDQSTVNFPNELVKIIFMYKQLLEKSELLKEQSKAKTKTRGVQKKLSSQFVLGDPQPYVCYYP